MRYDEVVRPELFLEGGSSHEEDAAQAVPAVTGGAEEKHAVLACSQTQATLDGGVVEEWGWEGEVEGEGRVVAREKEGEEGLTGDSMRGKRLGGGDMWVERSRTPILGGCHGPLADFVPLDRTGMRGTSASISFRGSRWNTWGRLAVGR